MDNQTPMADPYEAVLADLRRKRLEIDNAILVIESVRGAPATDKAPATGTPATGATTAPGGGKPSDGPMRPGAFLGMTVADAARALLARERRQMSNGEIYAGLTQGGLRLTSKEPLNTVGSILHRRFKDTGDVVRIGRGAWGLKEWYPGRNFKPALAKGGDEVAGEPSEADLLGGFDAAGEEANADTQSLENEFA